MEKRGVRLSKTFLQAQFFSFVTLIVVGAIILGVATSIPSTVYAKIAYFQQINNNSPDVYNTYYYQRLSAIANKEDWLLFSPLSFLAAGIVFGAILSSRRRALSLIKGAANTGVIWSVLSLLVSLAGSYAEDTIRLVPGQDVLQATLNAHYVGMFILQTAYWTLAFVGGSVTGEFLRTKMPSSARRQTAGASLPAVPSK